MSFNAQVFRILIASPSDVSEERDIAVQTIQEWNNLNSADRQVVLLPLRWESHGAPEFGKRPQEIINKQVVDYCDLLVGVFWTRVGSPTGVADSGTIEEIERVSGAGKKVMLYFSQARQDPDQIDTEQLSKLREFKKKTLPNSLIENYKTHIEFKEKLSRQLEIQLRSLLASGSSSSESGVQAAPYTDIVFSFASPDTGDSIGDSVSVKTRRVVIEDFAEIPDYEPKKSEENSSGAIANKTEAGLRLSDLLNIHAQGMQSTRQIEQPNKQYFRQLATYRALQGFFAPIRFSFKNIGAVGARDVYVELEIDGGEKSIYLVGKEKLPSTPPKKVENATTLLGSTFHPVRIEEIVRGESNSWATQMEIRALQPQRSISPEHTLLVGSSSPCSITITATIYADTLAQPLVRKVILSLNVEELLVKFREILQDQIEVGMSDR